MALLPPSGLCLLGLLVLNPFVAAEASSCLRNCAGCPRNWFRYQGNCYGYFDTKKTWEDAEVACQYIHPRCHLASILNQAESRLVARYISLYRNVRDVWIGLHDPNQNGLWRWTDRSVYYYNAWGNGQPNNLHGNQFCVHLDIYTGLKQWNDLACEARNSYICQLPAVGWKSAVSRDASQTS